MLTGVYLKEISLLFDVPDENYDFLTCLSHLQKETCFLLMWMTLLGCAGCLLIFLNFQSFAVSCHSPFPALALPPFCPRISASARLSCTDLEISPNKAGPKGVLTQKLNEINFQALCLIVGSTSCVAGL